MRWGGHPEYPRGARPIVVRVALRLQDLHDLHAVGFQCLGGFVELVLVHRRGQVNQNAGLVASVDRIARDAVDAAQ